jgi:hypothetical protein
MNVFCLLRDKWFDFQWWQGRSWKDDCVLLLGLWKAGEIAQWCAARWLLLAIVAALVAFMIFVAPRFDDAE